MLISGPIGFVEWVYGFSCFRGGQCGGKWCLVFGMLYKFLNFSKTRILDPETRSLLSGQGLFDRTDPYFRLRDLEHQARSKADFVKHVRVCRGCEGFIERARTWCEASKNWI